MTSQEALAQALHEWECQGQPCTIMGSHQASASAILDAGFGVYIEEQRTQAATEEYDRLRTLYLDSEMRYCADVMHTHKHEWCNGRCWGSWADPENCPDVCGNPFSDPDEADR